MKLMIALLALLTTFSVFAINEVECEGQNSDSQRVEFDIEMGWGGSIRDARLLVYSTPGNAPDETLYRIYNHRVQNRRWVYSGTDGARLEVDFFPDEAPRWGRRYRGYLTVSSDRIGSLNCRFPQVRP